MRSILCLALMAVAVVFGGGEARAVTVTSEDCKNNFLVSVDQSNVDASARYHNAVGNYESASSYARDIIDLGNSALRAGCLDTAERAYRAVIQEFPQPQMEGYRDQAKLGLDDVREARRKH